MGNTGVKSYWDPAYTQPDSTPPIVPPTDKVVVTVRPKTN